MSNVNPETATTYADLDWDRYIKSRPSYPTSLRDIVCNYRRHHSQARWTRIVDIGGGVGVSSTLYASDFDTVHLLDPSPSNHEKAHVFLNDWIRRHNLSTKLEFTQATAEEGHRYIKDADLVICAEAAHFIDPQSLIDSAASMLRPAGTLAIYSYWTPIFPDQSPQFSEAFTKVITQTISLCIKPDDEATRSLFSKVMARISAGPSVLDSIPVPEEQFEDIQRVRINPAAERLMEVFRDTYPVPHEPIASQVGAREGRVVYDTGEHEEADGWCFEVDNEWLHGFLATFRPADMVLSQEQYESVYGEWDRLFREECPSGVTRALWPVNIILATRR